MPEQQFFSFARPPKPEPPALPPPPAGDEAPEAAAMPAGDVSHAALPEGPLKRLIDTNFIQYASYVIRDRAIPDLADGLKPVQRRILYSLHQNDDGKLIKVANIVGYCMQFHPHGDASIGEALVGLVNRQYLVEGQGNFGNLLTGDPAAAARYIECRLTDLARTEIFNPDLTEHVPTYDGRRKEPVTLPAKLPLLLMLGADGIAVGLSTRIFPHNFGELLEAQVAILQKKKFTLYPDFQQGGCMDVAEYNDGNGRIRLRAVIEVRDPATLVIREIPFGVTTDTLIASVEDAARRKKIHIKAIHDFTAEKVEIEIKLGPDQDAQRTLQALYAFTLCESAMSGHLVVIRDRRPVEMTVSEVLRFNTEETVRILRKELLLEKKRIQDELHRKTLLEIFIEHRIYQRIEECRSPQEMHERVLAGVNEYRAQLERDVTHEDVEMLLGIPIKRISRFDLERNRQDLASLRDDLVKVEKNLGELVPYAIRYLRALLKKHGPVYPRHTRITRFESIEIRKLTENELAIGQDREKGYLGFDVTGEEILRCSSYDRLILVWDDGRYKVIPPPEKLFVDQGLLYCAVEARDRVMTAVYTDGPITYLKRFTFGGAIMNKDYRCAPEGAKVLLLAGDDPEEIYVRYAKEKRQRINQQVFHPRQLAVKNVKTRGMQMTVKTIRAIATRKPRNWDQDGGGPRGVFMDLG